MKSVTLSPPNAIIFVIDPTNKNTIIPPYVSGELVAATTTCVSVGTQADVDGDSTIVLSSSDPEHSDLIHVWDGSVETPGHKVAIVTAEFQRILDADILGNESQVSVWVDDLQNPSEVYVKAR